MTKLTRLAPFALAAALLTACTPLAQGVDTSPTTVSHDYMAIAALDYESAAVIAELGYADRLVLIPEAAANEMLSGHASELAGVANTFPTATGLGPEAVMRVEPDLIVLSTRHGADETLGSVFESAGFQTLQLENSWTTPEQVGENIQLIGDALGASADAQALRARLTEGFADAAASAQHGDGDARVNDAQPNVMVLTNQAGRPFITAGDAHPLRLLELAGAHSASDSLGINTTGPITLEQIVQAEPDAIVLIDMNGSGDALFRDILTSPAFLALPASHEERLLRVTGRDVQAVGLTDNIAGLRTLTTWVAGL